MPDFDRLKIKKTRASQKQRPEVFSKTGAVKSFANFIGKQLCWSHFLIKFQAWRPEIFKKTYFKEHLRMTASESWDNFEMLRENIFKRISLSATSSCALDLKGNKKFLYITIWNEFKNNSCRY